MIDPDALPHRRAWVACSRCDDGSACSTCRSARTCDQHWRYLLGADRRKIFVQCPSCHYRWWHDTGSHPDRACDRLDRPGDDRAA